MTDPIFILSEYADLRMKKKDKKAMGYMGGGMAKKTMGYKKGGMAKLNPGLRKFLTKKKRGKKNG